jgi:hypothetical protein
MAAQSSTRAKPSNKRYKETGQKARNKARRIAKEAKRQERLKARQPSTEKKGWRAKMMQLDPTRRDFDSLRILGITPSKDAPPAYRKDSQGNLRDVSGFTYGERPFGPPTTATPSN